MTYTIRALDADVQTAAFECGEQALDLYLQRYASQDIKLLLVDACKRVAVASETLAVAAIVVDAKSPQAAAFHQHFGFIELPGQSGRWMLPRSHFAEIGV